MMTLPTLKNSLRLDNPYPVIDATAASAQNIRPEGITISPTYIVTLADNPRTIRQSIDTLGLDYPVIVGSVAIPTIPENLPS